MLLEGKRVGFAFTGSFCTFKSVITEIKKLVEEGANVLPIMSFNAFEMDTRFGEAKEVIEELKEITGNEIIHTINGAEPIGPKQLTDVIIIAPCTGNTIGKLANGISDTPVLMAAKSHLRNENSLVLGISTNDRIKSEVRKILENC